MGVIAAMGWGLSEIRYLNTHYSMNQFMPKEHALYKSDRLIKNTFRLAEQEPIIVNLQLPANAPGTWLEPARVAQIEKATVAMAGIEKIQGALSVANVETANNTEKGIQVDRLVRLVPPAKWKKRVLEDPLLTPGLISSDGRVVTLVGDIGILTESEVHTITDQIRERVGAALEGSGATFMVSGVIPLQSQITALLSRELLNFFGLAFLVCLITLVAYFRSYSTVFVCLLLVVIANITTFAVLAVLGIPFSVLSSALPIICSIEALAIGSHTLLIFGDNYRQAMAQPNPASKAQVVWSTYKSLLFPNFLMSTTTTIGFATLIASHVPLIRQFSQSVSGGIMMSCVIMSIALPSLMYLFPIPVARSWTGGKARWALWVIHHRRLVLAGGLAVVALFAVTGLRLNWAVQLYDDLPQVGDIKTSADLIDQKLGGMIPLEVMVQKTGEESPWNEPARMQKLREVLSRWRKDPAVGSAIGLPDLLSHNIQATNSRKAIAETLFLYSFSGADNPASRFLSNDGNSTRLMFRMKDVNAEQMKVVLKNIEADIKNTFPGFSVHSGGMAALVHPLNEELSSDLIFGLWHSLVIISVLLILVFRSVRLALIAAVPNLLPPLALLGAMAYLKTPVKPVVAIIFSIALGLAYNNTVFLLTRLKKIQGRFKDAADVICRTWYQEGNPCLFSSLAVIGGFAVFMASYFSPNRTFGAYMLWSILMGLVGDLILLPALLRVFPWFVLPRVSLPKPNLAGSQSWSKNFLFLGALLLGLGPTATASAPSVVRTPFVLTMKKESFGPLLYDGVIAKSTVGVGTIPLSDIVLTDPIQVHATGIELDLDYAFEAPASAQKPAEWTLNSKKLLAQIRVARIDAHQIVKVIRGENEFEVRMDGYCTDVKLALPPGAATAAGRLTLGSKNGSPRLVLNDFKANWTPGSWQVVSMNCVGPDGFGDAVARTAGERLRQIDPYFGSIEAAIQEKLDSGLNGPIALELGNPIQRGQTLRLNAPAVRANEKGDMVVHGEAIFYFLGDRESCGADIGEFRAKPVTKPGDTALILPFETLKALLACTHGDRSLAFDTDSSKFPAFQELQQSYFKKNAVWPDLNNFTKTDLFKFHGETAGAPELTGEKSVGGHAFTAKLAQKVQVDMYAPKNGKFVPYTRINVAYNGPVRVSVVGGKISVKPDFSGKLSIGGGFLKSYVETYGAKGSINWERLQPPVQEAFLKQGWSFQIPSYGVSQKIRIVPKEGDLQSENFRIGFEVQRLK